jgi:hypothetical protein
MTGVMRYSTATPILVGAPEALREGRGCRSPDAASENGLGQPPLFRDQRRHLALTQRGPGQRRAQWGRIGGQHLGECALPVGPFYT